MTRHALLTGAAHTAVGNLAGSTCMSLHAEAALGALADAGVRPEEIDAVLCAYSLAEPHLMLASVFCEYLGLQPSYSAAIQAGGATGCIMVMQAAALVEAGFARHVLVVCGDNRLSGMTRDRAVAAIAEVGHAQFERPYGISVPASYAMVARRYMHEFGVTEEDMAAVTVAARKHAMRHPQAQMRTPVTVADVMASKSIASPLKILDCCLISDGGAALVVSAAETGRDRPRRPVTILGTGHKTTHEHIVAAPSLIEAGCAEAAAQAMGRAGVKVTDFDVAEIYDSFTITLISELESIGFFGRGEAGPAIAAGATDLGGRIPCNTHGGLMAFGHSGAAGGLFHVVEAVRQLRGEADERQVKDAELAFVHGDGGILSAHCSLVLGRS